MKIQNRTEYGVRALVLLAERGGDGPLPMPKIAELEGIPVAFLEQILALLRRSGLIVSVRGPGGGFKLARPAEEITMDEVIRVLEGSLSPIGCVGDGGEDAFSACERIRLCQTRKVWVRMTECMEEALGRLTLSDVLDE